MEKSEGHPSAPWGQMMLRLRSHPHHSQESKHKAVCESHKACPTVEQGAEGEGEGKVRVLQVTT